ncbi:MAG: pyruvate kinase, partial [Anaerolineae bacterium]
QMLESMIHNPRPTRAEASDVANAILDGTDAIMLSGETAVGRYPLEALRTMVKIAQRAEAEVLRRNRVFALAPPRTKTIAEAVSHAACETARDLDAAAVITPTVSGYTARMVAKYRPYMPIIAVTPSPMVQRQLCLYWGVYPLLAPRTANTDQMLADAIHTAREHGFVQSGQLIVATGGAAGSAPGTTNLIKVQEVERILVTGTGIGNNRVYGQVRLIRDTLPEPTSISSADILVVSHTTREHVPLARRAAGLIVEEGGIDSHAAQMALELGVTAVIGAQGALSLLRDGQIVTLDPIHGRVYEGHVQV